MKVRTLTIAAVFVAASAVTGFAQLSMSKADWAQGPVKYLMTKDEQAQWNALKSDADADQFIALFWARRDPTPSTPENEFKEAFDQRVAYADQHFGTAREKGSMTDRGRILILFGPPTRALRSGGTGGINRPTTPSFNATPGSTPGTEAEDTSTTEQQLWQYEGDAAQKEFGAPRVELRFIDRSANGDFRLETPRIDLNAATQRVVMAAITQPNLTKVPTFRQAQQPTPAPQPAAPAGPVTTFKTPAFETAVTNVQPSTKATVSSTEFVAPSATAEPYVSTGIFASGLAADAADTVFGVVTD
ncbi:MAG TPA: GWxTD domain-containing protein, partial [Thermoanaerobaculia bacterium]|nr:GWxTD domain-containing protein [Thermoanaerobaculia bacterium]